jgi:LPS-assembly protein
MNNICKGKAKYLFFGLLAFGFAFNDARGEYLTFPIDFNSIFTYCDTLPIANRLATDTIVYPKSKDSLTAPVVFSASDSMVIDVPANKLFLYGNNAKLDYQDNALSAPVIQYDQSQNKISAFLKKDSSGNVISYPSFKQADFKSVSDSIFFNMQTGKGLTKGTYTQQGEMFVYGEKIKKVGKDDFYAGNSRFTTCNLDTPHFAFVSSKIKFINNKVAFTGPVHPEIEGVPLPSVLPFGIYPLKTGMHSGVLAPSFSANNQLGLAMEGIGYYRILSPNWDVVTRGTLYSYGGWTFNVSPRYNRRYRYQGNFSLDMQRFKNGFKGDPDYYSSQTFNVRWSHSADSKARPGVSFNANVNAGSSKFNAQVPNSPNRNFANQLSSSITYAKVWKDKPYNLSVSANHNQNTQQRLINLNLPDVSFNVNTLYPFRKKEALGNTKWYENIGIALNTNARSMSSFYDTASDITQQFADNFKWGASHNVPVTLALPSLGPFQISPSVSYQERWYQEKFIRSWNEVDKKLDTVVANGMFTARDMSFGLGMTTRIFGSFGFRPKSKIQAIRHEIRPSISASYKPNMNARSYYQTKIDTSGRTAKYSYYERSVFGVFSDVKFGGLNFGLDNVLQMKVKKSKDTSMPLKKVTLIDGLSINGSYNFLVDSFQMSNLNLSARSNLFDKINITANANFDPYQYNEEGRRINKLIWSDKPLSLGRLIGGGLSLQSRFKGGKGNQSTTNTTSTNNRNAFSGRGNQQDAQMLTDDMTRNPADYVDFSIPWDVDIAYSLRFNRAPLSNSSGGDKINVNSDVNFSGHISIAPKWQVGVTGSYNVSLKEMGVFTMNISRDLHCWQLTINLAPVGRFRFFTINLAPKSGLLQDLKINRTRYFFDL